MHIMLIIISTNIYLVLDEKHFMGFVVCLVMAGQNENYYFIMLHFKLMSHHRVSHIVMKLSSDILQ